MKGTFITFEGVEGCGKTTQIARAQAYLCAQGRPVDVTREPGGSPIAEAIRRLLLDAENTAMTPVAELLLYEAARAQHVEERIRPALEAGITVLCDRFADSTTVYQGAARGLDRAHVTFLHEMATRGVWPDRTIVIDVPAEEGLRRATQYGSDRLEREHIDFHRRVREGFLTLAREDPHRVRIVDGMQSVDAVADAIRPLLDEILGEP
ncbi:MAG TPA: dTMP kinase [Candidatus Hydrogenedentes bacterium]|nr:dTMP kinase [Candidatus Hydrogenedentota bacterium]HPG68806.1 dTMP kinase [Candidatus Hydrogenedentota bacterium]